MRKIIAVVLGIFGALVLLSGLLFFLQGTGLFPYPRTSFMINEQIWVIRGAILFILGFLLMFLARWLRRSRSQ
ncbi:hypothetical protein AB4090_05505 [Acidithiobacillus sp. IBUN Pt1247-S3]|uniref:hypothetical protein n=1 Tax=Acidithiobacillus sp. IBUN Pt1247-S3 TaxID=3166642 RepID=UPI0034E5D4AD